MKGINTYKRTEKHKRKISQTLLGHFVSEITRERLSKANQNLSVEIKEVKRQRMSKLGKQNGGKYGFKKGFIPWNRGKKTGALSESHIRNIIKACRVTPNKAELLLNSFLQQFLPNEYRYVGDGEFILAGKCPDFININGQKKIIELYGNYWHRGETGKNRINLFQQYGYETLIIWENELNNIEILKDKILQFNAGN